jgi:hypothetical protein
LNAQTKDIKFLNLPLTIEMWQFYSKACCIQFTYFHSNYHTLILEDQGWKPLNVTTRYQLRYLRSLDWLLWFVHSNMCGVATHVTDFSWPYHQFLLGICDFRKCDFTYVYIISQIISYPWIILRAMTGHKTMWHSISNQVYWAVMGRYK